MTPERINTLWQASYWVWPNDLERRLDLFELMIRLEASK